MADGARGHLKHKTTVPDSQLSGSRSRQRNAFQPAIADTRGSPTARLGTFRIGNSDTGARTRGGSGATRGDRPLHGSMPIGRVSSPGHNTSAGRRQSLRFHERFGTAAQSREVPIALRHGASPRTRCAGSGVFTHGNDAQGGWQSQKAHRPSTCRAPAAEGPHQAPCPPPHRSPAWSSSASTSWLVLRPLSAAPAAPQGDQCAQCAYTPTSATTPTRAARQRHN